MKGGTVVKKIVTVELKTRTKYPIVEAHVSKVRDIHTAILEALEGLNISIKVCDPAAAVHQKMFQVDLNKYELRFANLVTKAWFDKEILVKGPKKVVKWTPKYQTSTFDFLIAVYTNKPQHIYPKDLIKLIDHGYLTDGGVQRTGGTQDTYQKALENIVHQWYIQEGLTSYVTPRPPKVKVDIVKPFPCKITPKGILSLHASLTKGMRFVRGSDKYRDVYLTLSDDPVVKANSK